MYGVWLEQFKKKVSRGQWIPRLKLVSDQFCDEVLVVLDRAPYNLSMLYMHALPVMLRWRCPKVIHTVDLDAFMGCSWGDDQKDDEEAVKAALYSIDRVEWKAGGG